MCPGGQVPLHMGGPAFAHGGVVVVVDVVVLVVVVVVVLMHRHAAASHTNAPMGERAGQGSSGGSHSSLG